MSKLREQIADFLEDISRPSETLLHADENLDYILALFAEAMLSDDVLDAATVGVNRWMMESFGHTGDPFEFSQGELNSLRPKRVKEIKAALAAAGITGAGQEGGEGE